MKKVNRETESQFPRPMKNSQLSTPGYCRPQGKGKKAHVWYTQNMFAAGVRGPLFCPE